MKTLIVEDELTAQKLMTEILTEYGKCDVAMDGAQAIRLFETALEVKEPYDLVCMDIMMPTMDGQQATKKIRDIEKKRKIKNNDGVKVIMTTALGDPKNVIDAFCKGGATSYIVKPIKKQKLLDEVKKLGLVH
jgi:two-component system, chemotaxis family, chemotaxis protein CheY